MNLLLNGFCKRCWRFLSILFFPGKAEIKAVNMETTEGRGELGGLDYWRFLITLEIYGLLCVSMHTKLRGKETDI